MIDLLSALNIQTALFTDDSLSIFDVVVRGEALAAEVADAILAANTALIRDRLDAAYDYLIEEDEQKRADLLFVFGSAAPYRIERAIELFKAGLAPKMLISGGKPIYAHETVLSEATRYKEIAVAAGVPEAAILIESESITIPHNIMESLKLLDRQEEKPQRIMLVNAPFAQRRGWAIWNKFSPEGTEFIRINANVSERFNRDNWFKNAETIRIILNEFIKMRASVVYNTA
ncbi:hypothetical protein CYG49_01560 [Candidatus Saccharibacteria bacterium]|nr:MAG: hypothetical protein CYG49_01560 [Candidatus Saccharibacteria bacterium]